MLRTRCHHVFAIYSIVFIFYNLTITAKRIEIETISCHPNSLDIIGDTNCFVRRDQNNVTKISMFINILKTVDTFDVRHTLELYRKNTAVRLKALDVKVNACKFLDTAQKQKILGIFKEQLKCVLNVVPHCPLKRNLRIELETLNCQHNASDYVGALSCTLRMDEKDNITKASMFINLIRKLKSFDFRYTLEMSRINMTRLKVMDVRVNVCNFLNTAQKQKLFKNFKEQILELLNVIPTCPIKRNFYLGFTRMQCLHNSSDIVRDFNCSLRSSDNNRFNMFDAYFIFSQPFISFDIQAIINVFPKKSRQWTLFNVRLNGCQFLEMAHRQAFFRIFTKTLNKYMNVKMLKCPMRENFNYTVSGFKYDENDFPSYVPESEVQGILHVFVKNKQIGFSTLWGYVKYLKKTVANSNGNRTYDP
ncbi:hypothetical protein FF38_09211 [Lucilia cuprina]|uniref:Uncharacterized protein n=1 Tax=Lucilia cuprina TaxID=7375 RepID=A0A0L0C6D4_LUCCU|nr:hypothetical protein FF38_09211 [Lucilia cuprina]